MTGPGDGERLPVPVDVGSGRAIVVLHGYGMRPVTYRRTAQLLAEGAGGRPCRVVIPNLFALRGHWSYDRVVDAFSATLDHLDIEEATLIGHSFGGAIELCFAESFPERVQELVFSDTLAMSDEWGLADEALQHPFGLLRLATPPAAFAFATQALLHPSQMAVAAWWGFRSKRGNSIEAVVRGGIPAHVLWANRDSIIPRSDGQEFAERLHATFTVARAPDGRFIDHDWMFQDPHLFVAHLRALRLRALASRRSEPRRERATPPTSSETKRSRQRS